MNAWTWAVLALLTFGVGSGLVLGCRGGGVARLIGLQLTGTTTVLVLLLLAHISGESGYLVVPLVLVPLSVSGMFVFGRLLVRPQ